MNERRKYAAARSQAWGIIVDDACILCFLAILVVFIDRPITAIGVWFMGLLLGLVAIGRKYYWRSVATGERP